MKVTITLNEAQARTVCDALDLYARIGIGQLQEVSSLVRQGFLVPTKTPKDAGWFYDGFDSVMNSAKSMLGLSGSSSYGIGHNSVNVDAKRAFELRKQIEKPMALAGDPDPGFRGVNYDGRIVRYTDDADITVEVTKS